MNNEVEYDFLTDEVIRKILKNSTKEDVILKKYIIFKASDKMLGFLADYWKLQIQIVTNDNSNQSLCFFIKAISKSNTAKAEMVKEMKLFEKETTFYTVIKDKLYLSGIRPWSPNLVMPLKEALIFEDLNCLQYKTRNKFQTFDKEHTMLSLEALARFHAATIIYEENKGSLKKPYCINDDYMNDLDRGGYQESDPWFIQCMNAGIEIVLSFSKYRADKNSIDLIEKYWSNVWKKALSLADFSFQYRNVICHRDLWNNNILFKYNGTNSLPDDCVLVDFQAVRCQPPAGDVMLLLYCNLEPTFREKNTDTFLNHYYNEMKNILEKNDVSIEGILSREDFHKSCEEQRLWGLVVSACLVPQFWIDDELITKYFSDTSNFQEIMTNNKVSFIKRMMAENNEYKRKVLCIFEEIVEQYCL